LGIEVDSRRPEPQKAREEGLVKAAVAGKRFIFYDGRELAVVANENDALQATSVLKWMKKHGHERLDFENLGCLFN